MAFAPVFTGEDESSGVWWWRLYLYMNKLLDEEDYQTAGQAGFGYFKILVFGCQNILISLRKMIFLAESRFIFLKVIFQSRYLAF